MCIYVYLGGINVLIKYCKKLLTYLESTFDAPISQAYNCIWMELIYDDLHVKKTSVKLTKY